MMKYLHGILLLLGIFFHAYPTNTVAFTTDSSSILYKRAFTLLADNHLDSALLTIRHAYSHGLSDDSLFYAWSEIYSIKGALDTALALSLAVKTTRANPLYILLLKQRIFLYSATNQHEKAARYLDTLSSLPAYRIRRLFPDVNVSISGGIRESETIEAASLPYMVEYQYPEEQFRTTAKGVLGLKWGIPLKKGRSIEPSFSLSASQNNPVSPFTLKSTFDSCSYISSLHLRYSHFSGKLSGGYAFKRSVNYIGDISLSHYVDIRYFNLLQHGYLFGETGYSYNLMDYTHNWYGFSYFNRDWTRRRSNALSLTISGYHDKEQVLRDYNILNMVYVDGFTFYSDSTFNQELPSTNRPIIFFIQNVDIRHNTVHAVNPQSYFSSNLKLSQRLTLRSGFTVSVDFEYGISWYPQEYIWLNYLYSLEEIPEVGTGFEKRILALNHQDGNKYWVHDISITDKTIVLDTIPILVNRKKRVDQILSVNANVKKKAGNYIEIGLSGMISRTFSTLGDKAPVDIPVWSYRVMLLTTLQFNPAGLLR